MKKIRKLCCIVLAVCSAAVCAVAVSACGGDKTRQELGSTLLQTEKRPKDLAAEEVGFSFLQKMQEREEYTVTTTASASLRAAIAFTQEMRSTTVKREGGHYRKTVSDSLFFRMTHEAYTQGESVVYRNGTERALSVTSQKDYRGVYGALPCDPLLEGFMLRDELIRFAERGSVRGDEATYLFVLEGAAGDYLAPMFMQLWELKRAPAFTSVQVRLTLKEDWTPVRAETTLEYRAEVPLLGDTPCTATIRSDYAVQAADIAEVADFRAALTQPQQGAIAIMDEDTPVMQLISGFTSLDYGGGVRFSITGSAGILEANGLMNGPLRMTADVRYHADAASRGDLYHLIELDLTADLTRAQTLLALLPLTLPDAEQVDLSAVRSLSVLSTGEGKLLLVLKDAHGEALYVKQVDVIALLLGIAGGGVGERTDITAAARIEESFTAQVTEEGTVLTLKEEALAKLAQAYRAGVNELARLAGEQGNLVKSALTATLTGAQLTIQTREGERVSLSLTINGIPASDGAGTERALLSLSLAAEEAPELTFDGTEGANILADEGAAAPVRAEIDRLAQQMWLGSDYAAAVAAAQQQLASLTPAQQALVYNRETLTGLVALHDERKQAADAFLALLDEGESEGRWAGLAALYDGKIETCAAQRAYIGESRIQAYLTARTQYEGERAAALSQLAAAFTPSAYEDGVAAMNAFYEGVRAPYLALSQGAQALVTGYEAAHERAYTAFLQTLSLRIAQVEGAARDALAAGSVDAQRALSVYRSYLQVDELMRGGALVGWQKECPAACSEQLRAIEEGAAELGDLFTWEAELTTLMLPALRAHCTALGLPVTPAEAQALDLASLSEEELLALQEGAEEVADILQRATDQSVYSAYELLLAMQQLLERIAA